MDRHTSSTLHTLHKRNPRIPRHFFTFSNSSPNHPTKPLLVGSLASYKIQPHNNHTHHQIVYTPALWFETRVSPHQVVGAQT